MRASRQPPEWHWVDGAEITPIRRNSACPTRRVLKDVAVGKEDDAGHALVCVPDEAPVGAPEHHVAAVPAEGERGVLADEVATGSGVILDNALAEVTIVLRR